MQILQKRRCFNSKSTVSYVSIAGRDICVFLEDKDRDYNQDGDHLDKELGEEKKYGETAIPYGEYPVILETKGTIYDSYKRKDWAKVGFPGFENIFRGSLMLVGIKGYERVHIHIGNFIKDTLGCPLTGTNANLTTDPFTVSGSTQAYVKLYKAVIEAFNRGEKVTLKIEKHEA